MISLELLTIKNTLVKLILHICSYYSDEKYILQCIIQYILYSVQCIICTLYNEIPVQYTLYIVHCTVYSVLWGITFLKLSVNKLYNEIPVNVHCTMYNVQCTLYIIQCILYNVHCSVYSVLWGITLLKLDVKIYIDTYYIYDYYIFLKWSPL